VGIVDSNNSIENISYVIPGNDDSSRAIRLYTRGMADAVMAGKNKAITDLAKSVSEETAEEE
jgi:small subunit ribosomal protein S2